MPESKTESSTTPQSGLMCEHSMDAASLARWASSLPDSPASPIASRGDDVAQPMTAISGQIRRESLLRYDPTTSSLRTSQVSFSLREGENHTLSKFLETLPDWVMWDGQELYRLVMSERPTGGTDGGAWPTISAGHGDHGGPNSKFGRGNLHLSGAAAQWPTPQVVDLPNKRANIRRWGGLNSLTDMAEKGTLGRQQTEQNIGLELGSKHEPQLWPTARANKVTTVSQSMAESRLWKQNLGDWAAVYPLGPQAPRMPMPGHESSPSGPNSPPLWATPRTGKVDRLEAGHLGYTPAKSRLNPLFVEWLMGLPIGWTDSRPLGMGGFRRWLRRFSGE